MENDIDKIIDKIISEINAAAPPKVYRDEPIIKPASQMKNYLPEKCSEMKKLVRYYEKRGHSRVYIFYKQGKFMEDYEDNFDFRGEFSRFFPTYSSMNDAQLRGYFAWRTKVRHGIYEKTQLSFVYVYIYELLNLIGASNAADGYEKLKNLREAYIVYETEIDYYLKRWMDDFIVYYNLDSALSEKSKQSDFDNALSTLLNADSYNDKQIFAALNSISTYNCEKSKFYKQYSEDMLEAVGRIYRRIAEKQDKNGKKTLCTKLFGKQTCFHYTMFISAVFYNRIKHENYTYELNSINKYRCINGEWSVERYVACHENLEIIGAVLKNIDCAMRVKYGYKHPLQRKPIIKTIDKIIEQELDAYLEEKRRKAAPVISIDISKLQSIRKTSEITQSKLITEEEKEEERQPEIINETSLSNDEYALTACLLYGNEYSACVKASGKMLSVLIDSVNEKMFDTFGDNIIVYEGDAPYIFEDYAQELKGIIKA